MWYNIISRIKERIDYNMDLDNNAHSVFLLYYHLMMLASKAMSLNKCINCL